MIDILHLSKSYGNTLAVDDLTLSVENGELFGLLGPNGAGKSTTVKIITGLLQPSTGLVRVGGFDVSENPLEVKKLLGYVPENAMLYEILNPIEYLNLIGDLRHLDRKSVAHKREELFELFELTSSDQKKLISEFSKGMKQKVLLVAALMHNPEVLIMDEPLSGLDANAALIVKEVIRKMAQLGKTVFFCSHVLDVVERLCDRIAILAHGKMISVGTPHELMQLAGENSLERAFNRLTGGADIERSSEEFLKALSSD